MRKEKRSLKKRPYEKFGRYLQGLRQDYTELNQSEAAERLGLKNKQELNQYENGWRMPPDSLLVRLAHLYHKPTAEVLERAYWPQLILLPLIAIIDPEKLPRDFIDEIEKGLKHSERIEITQHIEVLLRRRVALTQ